MKKTLAEMNDLTVLPLLDLLYEAHRLHRMYQPRNEVQISSLCSIKTGLCPENCQYCSQSAHHNTGLEYQPLLNIDTIVKHAITAKGNGVQRFCMGAAWRKLHDRDLELICNAIVEVKKLGLETCMTLGMVTLKQAHAMKAAGLDYYNHNIDTSEEFYETIITTRTFDDRLETLDNIVKADIKVCCGGIVGMGENEFDRIKMLFIISEMEIVPHSVPINMLVKVKGTPMENLPDLDIMDFIRTIAYARIILPHSILRLSAGRIKMSKEAQALCFFAGANSIFYGDDLLTTPNNDVNEDLDMLKSFQLKQMT